MFRPILFFSVALAILASTANAQTQETVTVTDGVFAFVGEKQPRTRENLANNATFGLIVTDEGCVLVDPGGSRKGAAVLHEAVKRVTDRPVRYVINTGGQDHRWLGNAYWRERGASIIASEAAVADHKDRGPLQLTLLDRILGPDLEGTEPAYADITFASSHSFTLGGVGIEIHHEGAAHTPGDSFVWVPARSTVFTGDIVYVERLLGVMEFSTSRTWLEAFDAMAALAPEHVVPGHGAPTTLARAKAETRDYLEHLRAEIGAHIEAGGDMIGAPKVDQSAFAHLELFDILAGRNAQAVFAEMEFE